MFRHELQSKYYVAASVPTVEIPKGSMLFHGTLERFTSGLHPGGDGMIWFADTPKIAQLYIPKSGGYTMVSPEHLRYPVQDPTTQALLTLLGIEYDYSKVTWKNYRAESFPLPKGWDKLPTEAEIKKLLDDKGFEKKYGSYIVRTYYEDGGQLILPPGESRQGRLFIAKTKEPLVLWRKAKGEGDLTDVQYNDLEGFSKAKGKVDGVLIDDFAQSEEMGNFGHMSVGLYDAKKLDVHSVQAQYREWEREPKGTPEYPNPPPMYFHKL